MVIPEQTPNVMWGHTLRGLSGIVKIVEAHHQAEMPIHPSRLEELVKCAEWLNRIADDALKKYG